MGTGTNLSVPASPSSAVIGSFQVAGYRSIILRADVTGNPVDYQIDWRFFDLGGSPSYVTSGQLPVGNSQVLLRCHGDRIFEINFLGSGGGATIDYTIVGSNLDPLPPSGGGTAAATVFGFYNNPAQTVNAGVNDIVTYDATTFRTTDDTIFSYDAGTDSILGSVGGFYIAWQMCGTAFVDLDSNQVNASIFLDDPTAAFTQQPNGGGDLVRFNGVTATSITHVMAHSFCVVGGGLRAHAELWNLAAGNRTLSGRIFCVMLGHAPGADVLAGWPGFP